MLEAGEIRLRINEHGNQSDGDAIRVGRRTPVQGQGLIVPSHRAILEVQRFAGNRAVADLLGSRLSVQRHPGTLPEVSAHTMTAVEEADLPTKVEAGELQTEQKELTAEMSQLKKTPAARRSDEDKERLKAINQRLTEINRKLALRTKGDALDEEAETLRRNKRPETPAEWFANVKKVTFLGHDAIVHNLLAERLDKAEKSLKGVAPPDHGWVQQEHSTLREPGQSLHSFGLAIDLNPGLNPFLVNPEDKNSTLYEGLKQSQAVRDVLGHAFLLVLGRSAADESFFEGSKLADRSARVEATYDKLAEASQALERYLTLDAPEKSIELQLRGLVLAVRDKDPENRTAADWATVIATDRATLKENAKNKRWSKPETGLLHLDKRLVKAMTDASGAGLTWLGENTVASGRDIMHFDMRGLGPITMIYKADRGDVVYLGPA